MLILTPPNLNSYYFTGENQTNGLNVGVRIAAGSTTGALAVLFAQPTDVVKVRFQAQLRGDTRNRYSSTMQAYKTIAVTEGAKGLWKGRRTGVTKPRGTFTPSICFKINLLQSIRIPLRFYRTHADLGISSTTNCFISSNIFTLRR